MSSNLFDASLVDEIADVGDGGEDNALVGGNVKILLVASTNLNTRMWVGKKSNKHMEQYSLLNRCVICVIECTL